MKAITAVAVCAAMAFLAWLGVGAPNPFRDRD